MDRINTKEYKNLRFVQWLRFLAEAVPNMRIGQALPLIKHEGDLWEATDGFRLHRVASDEMPEMDNGFYEVVKNTKSETILIKADDQDIQWPDTEAAWPKHKGFVEIAGDQFWLYTDLVRKLPENRTVRYSSVNRLFEFSDFWTAYVYKDEDAGIKFEAGPMTALIAPMMRK